MIKVVITDSKGWQIVAPNKGGVNRISRKQLVARHQVVRGLQSVLVKWQNSQQGKQSQWSVKVHFFQHVAMALEVAQHPFGKDFFVLDDPGAKINEQSFGNHNGRK